MWHTTQVPSNQFCFSQARSSCDASSLNSPYVFKILTNSQKALGFALTCSSTALNSFTALLLEYAGSFWTSSRTSADIRSAEQSLVASAEKLASPFSLSRRLLKCSRKTRASIHAAILTAVLCIQDVMVTR